MVDKKERKRKKRKRAIQAKNSVLSKHDILQDAVKANFRDIEK